MLLLGMLPVLSHPSFIDSSASPGHYQPQESPPWLSTPSTYLSHPTRTFNYIYTSWCYHSMIILDSFCREVEGEKASLTNISAQMDFFVMFPVMTTIRRRHGRLKASIRYSCTCLTRNRTGYQLTFSTTEGSH